MTKHVVPVTLVFALIIAACGDVSDVSGGPFNVVLPDPHVLVSLDSDMIGHPTDIAVTGAGQIWIVDVVSKRVVALSPDGTLVQRIGREGDGPGEFQAPIAVAVDDTLVRVYDSRHKRIQDYTATGRHLTDHTILASSSGPVALTIDGRIMLSTLGRDSALAIVRSAEDSTALSLGPPVSPVQRGLNFPAMKAEILEGRVPNQMRNQVTPVAGQGGAMWLILHSESEIRKYSPDGTLAWSHGLSAPEIDHARNEFFRRNAEQPDPMRISALTTVDAARAVANDLWLLMTGESGEAVIYIVSGSSGEMLGRVSVNAPGQVTQFAVDVARKRLYLASAEIASLLVIDLSQVRELAQLQW